MMKILLVNSIYYPDVLGGAEISVKLLAEDLFKQGNEVAVVCLSNEDKHEVLNGVEVFRVKNLNLYHITEYMYQNQLSKLIWHLRNTFFNPNKRSFYKVVDGFSPDIILSQNLLGFGLVPWSYAKKRNLRLAQTIRDYNILRPTKSYLINRLYSINFRLKHRYVNTFIGISHYSLNYFLSLEKNNLKNRIIIPNKIPIDENENNSEKRIKNSVGFVGQITKDKGIYLFMDTVTDPKIYHNLSEIYIVGDGPELKLIKQSYDSFKKVHFMGKIDHTKMNDIYSKLDFIIVPSLWNEPFGRVIIEAYNKGVYVYASQRGGIPEVIIDDYYLFDPDNKFNLLNKVSERVNKIDYQDTSSRDDLNVYASKYSENVSHYLRELNNII